MWRLTFKVPEFAAHVLIQNLPVATGLSNGIPEEVLSQLNNNRLETLLGRPDVELRSLRKKILFESAESRELIKYKAIAFNFDLDPSEFGAILTKSEEEKRSILSDLATSADDLSLWVYQALDDLLCIDGMSFIGGFAKESLERRVNRLQGWKLSEQLLNLRLYRLSEQIVPWRREEGGSLPSELKFLKRSIVPGDTLATFAKFLITWKESYEGKSLTNYLPSVEDVVASSQDR